MLADVRERYIAARQIRVSKLFPDLISPLNGGVKDEEDASRAQYTIVTTMARQSCQLSNNNSEK